MRGFFLEEKPNANSDTTPKLTVESINNHVYYYADVNSDRILSAIKQIRELDTSLRNERLSRQVPDDMPLTPIWLHIQSGGGSLFAGFSFADQLKLIPTPVYSVVEGYCASAATLLSVACAKRYILTNAFMMIHQLRNFVWGKYEEFKDEMHVMDMAMERLTEFYAGRTKISREEVQSLLQRDSWFSAAECVEKGLVDETL